MKFDQSSHPLFHPLLDDAAMLLAGASSPGPVLEGGTLVPLSIWVNIYFVYLSLLAIYAFLLSRAVAKGYSLLYPFKFI